MTSRERMLAAITGKEADVVPCAFMLFSNLRSRCQTEAEFVGQQLAMGLDACTHVGYLEPSLHPDATEKTWTSQEGGDTLFHRRIDTPKGTLTQVVVQSGGWPTIDNFHPFSDYIVPRAREVLVKPEEDLEKLPYVFGPFQDESIRRLKETAEVSRRLASEHKILQVGGWNSQKSAVRHDDGVMGADAMAWLSGYLDVMILSITRPDVIREYLRIIHEWNLRNIQVYLDVTDAELIVRRGWYETTEFWTPAAYRDLVAPFLKKEAELVHQAGKRLGLIVTSAFMPILDDILATGVDVLIGLDPQQGKGTDLAQVKAKCQAANCAIWGGVSGAMIVEQGTAEDTEKAVIEALRTLGKGGGFVLSPVDNVRDDTPKAWDNTRKFIEVWQQHRAER